jgi:hypothetical protein
MDQILDSMQTVERPLVLVHLTVDDYTRDLARKEAQEELMAQPEGIWCLQYERNGWLRSSFHRDYANEMCEKVAQRLVRLMHQDDPSVTQLFIAWHGGEVGWQAKASA